MVLVTNMIYTSFDVLCVKYLLVLVKFKLL